MGVEIEHKFLIRRDLWKPPSPGTLYRQGYLSSAKERVVRVRIAGEAAFLTIKGQSSGLARAEFEYPIPLADAAALLDGLCERPLIEKTRYRVPFEGHIWEVDHFHGDNEGLLLAEIEVSTEDERFALPPWVGEEVSHDPRYFNSNLVAHPFSTWAHAKG